MVRYLFQLLLVMGGLYLISPRLSQAHGPQMQIDISGGKIVTRSILVDDYTPLTDPVRVYVLPINSVDVISPLAGTEWRPNPSPGFACEYAPGLANSIINLGFTGGLQAWTGTAFVDAGTAQMQAYKTNSNGRFTNSIDDALSPLALVTTAAAPVPAGAHSGLTYKLLGNGSDPLSAIDDGIYLIGVQLTSVAATLTTTTSYSSDPFYFLMNKNMSSDAVNSAYSSFMSSTGFSSSQVQAFTVIPEPSTWALAVTAIGLVWSVRRKIRRAN